MEKKNLTLFHSSRKNTHRKMSWNSFFLSFYVPFCMIHFKISQRCWAWQWVPPATAMEVQGTQVEHLLVISKLICFFLRVERGRMTRTGWSGVGCGCPPIWVQFAVLSEDSCLQEGKTQHETGCRSHWWLGSSFLRQLYHFSLLFSYRLSYKQG